MKGGDGFMQAYNAQLAVGEHCQVIVATGVTNQAADNVNLIPMLERIKGHLGEVPGQTTGDTGYWHGQVAEQARALGCEALVATQRRRHGECGAPSGEGEPPEGTRCTGADAVGGSTPSRDGGCMRGARRWWSR